MRQTRTKQTPLCLSRFQVVVTIDGKTFNPNKEHDAPGEYGKVVFAEKVVRPNARAIDFTGFDPLLTRLEAVIEHYAKRKNSVLPSKS